MILIRSVLTCLSRCVSTNQVAANAAKPVRLEKGRVRLSYSAELYREREREKGPVTHTGQNCDIMSTKNTEDRYVCVFLPVFMLCVLVLSTYTFY